jgi:hypothetical protein
VAVVLRRASAGGACALALLLCSCGGGAVKPAGPAARAHIRATIVTFMRELAVANGKVACEGLTNSGQNSVIGALGPELANFGIDTCSQTVALTGSQLAPTLRRALAAVRVGSVSLAGSRASVDWSQITSPEGDLAAFFGHPKTMRLLETAGFWQIDRL